MKRRINLSLRKVIGFLLLPLGILGGFLPIMPGFIFFMLGLTMISDKFSLSVKNALRRYRCHGDFIKFVKELFTGFKDSFFKKSKKDFKKPYRRFKA